MNSEKDYLPDLVHEYVKSSKNPSDPFFIMEKLKTWFACENFSGLSACYAKNQGFLFQYNSAEDLNLIIRMFYESLIIKTFK